MLKRLFLTLVTVLVVAGASATGEARNAWCPADQQAEDGTCGPTAEPVAEAPADPEGGDAAADDAAARQLIPNVCYTAACSDLPQCAGRCSVE